jgi:hypothetical protein
VPRLINQAGMNRLSVGCRIDERKVEGWNLNLRDIIVMLKRKRPILSRKKMTPIVYRPWKSHGTRGWCQYRRSQVHSAEPVSCM